MRRPTEPQQTGGAAGPAAPGYDLERLHYELDVAIDKVVRARGILGRLERMSRPPAALLDLLARVRRNLADAHAWTRNAEQWIVDEEVDLAPGDPGAAAEALVDKLESSYRPRASECCHRLTLLEPAPVSLEALRFALFTAAGSIELCGRGWCPLKADLPGPPGAADPDGGAVSCLMAEQAALRQYDAFQAEKPGALPLLDRIDPRARLRRQTRAAQERLAQGASARIQFTCLDSALGPVFVRMIPDREARASLRYSCDKNDWRLLHPEPVSRRCIDPVTLLRPFVFRDDDRAAMQADNDMPTHAQLAALRPRGSA